MTTLSNSYQQDQRVCLSVLGYNNMHDTIECLESISQLDGGPYTILFVDNGSEDNSSEIVKRYFPEVNILKLSTNLGFSVGTNRGLQWACEQGFDFCLILNNDVILDKEMVNEMISVADDHEDCAVVMPRIKHYPLKVKDRSSRENIWSDGGYYRKFPPSIKLKDNRRKIIFDDPRVIEFSPGCALLIKCSVLDSIGYFDENYFLFYEDWDFSLRVREAGFSIWCAPQAILHHKVSRSTMKNPFFYWKHMGKSMSLFFYKHYNKSQARSHFWFCIIRDFIFRPKNLKYIKPFLQGAKAFSNFSESLN